MFLLVRCLLKLGISMRNESLACPEVCLVFLFRYLLFLIVTVQNLGSITRVVRFLYCFVGIPLM